MSSLTDNLKSYESFYLLLAIDTNKNWGDDYFGDFVIQVTSNLTFLKDEITN